MRVRAPIRAHAGRRVGCRAWGLAAGLGVCGVVCTPHTRSGWLSGLGLGGLAGVLCGRVWGPLEEIRERERLMST